MEWFSIPLIKIITSANPWVPSNTKKCTLAAWRNPLILQPLKNPPSPSTLTTKITTNQAQASSCACVSQVSSNLYKSQTALNQVATKPLRIQTQKARIRSGLGGVAGGRSWKRMNPCTQIRTLFKRKGRRRGGSHLIWRSWKNSKINIQRHHQRSKSSKTLQSC